MDNAKVTNCDNCPLWNGDRDFCQHPNCTVEDRCPEYGEYYNAQAKYFADCPLKVVPITIKLIDDNVLVHHD